jgi:hypothetical protein
MPVLWAIDHLNRLVVATAKGELHLKDIENYLDGVARAATLSYRKLFDMTQGSPALSKQDRLALAARLRDYNGTNAMGPAAIVALPNESYQQARLFETLTVADRPLKIFGDLQAARDWLNSEPVAALAPPALEEWAGPTVLPEVQDSPGRT